MSTFEHPMPDFADALERHLRRAAVEHGTASLASAFPLPAAPDVDTHAGTSADHPTGVPAGRPTDAERHPGASPTADRGSAGRTCRRPARPRPYLRLPVAAGSLTVLGVVVALVLLLSGGGPTTPQAFGEPLITRTPLVALPTYARPGSVARFVLGPESARIRTGNAFPVGGGTAYLYRNAAGVCLNAPTPSSRTPEVDRGVTCVPIQAFRRFGILGAFVGETEADVVVAVPVGADPPTVSVRGGAPRTLRPSDIGVVTYHVTAPTAITLFGPAELTQVQRFLEPSARPGRAVQGTPIDPDDVPPPSDVPAPGGR